MKKTNKILVPALTGKFSKWRYYQMVLPVKEIVRNLGTEANPNFRVKAVEEVEEIYARKGVSELLQRAFDPKRLDPIKNYILKQPDKYINNLTLAIFGGNPEWHDLSLFGGVKSDDYDEKIRSIEKQVGFIELMGTETLFVLDGQHRLKGLREAFKENPDKIGEEEVVCTLIIHNPSSDGRIRTRRLFSTVNRQAKPVSKGENILLDEDDASAIIVRELIENYKHFKGKEIIALSKGGNISKGDWSKFSTVITLNDINEKLIEHSKIYPKIGKDVIRVRPTDKAIEEQKKRVFKFWDTFFGLFPSALEFVRDTEENRKTYRIGGGNFLLRPISQIILFEIIYSCIDDKDQLDKLKLLPLDLNDEFWHYTLWDPHKMVMLFNRGHGRNWIKYNVGMYLRPSELKSLKDTYKKNSGDLELALPNPKY